MKVAIRPVISEDLPAVAALIETAFAAEVASHFGEAGRATFRSFATVERIGVRLANESEGWVAVDPAGAIVGYAEMTGDHLRMLFTLPERQGGGIGRTLFEHARGRRNGRDITVHASPNAALFYERMGFRPTGPRQEKHGIAFIPMLRPARPAPPAPRR